jgi:hypothetical protein
MSGMAASLTSLAVRWRSGRTATIEQVRDLGLCGAGRRASDRTKWCRRRHAAAGLTQQASSAMPTKATARDISPDRMLMEVKHPSALLSQALRPSPGWRSGGAGLIFYIRSGISACNQGDEPRCRDGCEPFDYRGAWPGNPKPYMEVRAPAVPKSAVKRHRCSESIEGKAAAKFAPSCRFRRIVGLFG